MESSFKKFSVLMSLYAKEKAEYFEESVKSLLNQTVMPDEIVIILDGPITDGLQTVLDKLVKDNPDLYNIVPLEKNVGLGLALREGVLHCKNELIARMDTDDICRKDRFEIQLKAFNDHPETDICGSQILEFEGTPDNVVSKRCVPTTHDEIVKYQRRRDAFNHMTVMYKKSVVLRAGNYQPFMLMEDSYLWCSMIRSGATCMNIEDSLVFVRVGKDLYARRGGLKYYRQYKQARKKIYKTGFCSWWDYKCTVIVQFFVALVPGRVRERIFKKRLHRL